jgi:hypothetical protein
VNLDVKIKMFVLILPWVDFLISAKNCVDTMSRMSWARRGNRKCTPELICSKCSLASVKICLSLAESFLRENRSLSQFELLSQTMSAGTNSSCWSWRFVSRWNAWVTFPIKYKDLPANSQVVISAWNVSAPRRKIPGIELARKSNAC